MKVFRRIRLVGLGLLASLVAATALPAAAASIDFESLALDELVTAQFAADDILFSNAVTLVAGISLNEVDFPPSSGTNVISGLAASALAVSFTQPAQLVRFQITTADVSVVSYYDELNTLLGQTLVVANLGGNTLVEFDAASPVIADVTFASQLTGNAFFLTVDDFDVEFGRSVDAAVPEPSAFLTMACGLVMVGAVIRRRV